MSKKPRLGSDPLSWINDSRDKKENEKDHLPDVQQKIDLREKNNDLDDRKEEAVHISQETQEPEKDNSAPFSQESSTDEKSEANPIKQKGSPVQKNNRYEGGKFLTFFLAGEEYGIEIFKVQEIIGMMPITPIPRTPEFIRGVINLRGKIIPVMDLRLKFGMESAEQTDETCIIVVQAQSIVMGIVVDKVSEVLDINTEDIEDAPTFGADVNTDFIFGIGKSEGRVKVLLDIDKVLLSRDVVDVHRAEVATPN